MKFIFYRQICVSLSGLADCYFHWFNATNDATKLALAREHAEHLRAIAVTIKSPEQTRIANEILADICRAEGVATPKEVHICYSHIK